MKWQSTAILAAITVGVGGYIWFVENQSAPPPAQGSVYLWDMSDAQASPIDRIVATEGGKSVTYVKLPPAPTPKPQAGSTPDPLATPPQPSWHEQGESGLGLTYMWDSAWSDLKQMEADRIVAKHPGPADSAIDDFASPSVEVTMYQGQKALYTLMVGKKAISGQGYYARTSTSPTIYEIASYKVDNLKKLVDAPPVATPTPAPTPSPTPVPTPQPTARPKAAAAATASLKAAALKLPGQVLGKLPSAKK